jgi:hypothetical protein
MLVKLNLSRAASKMRLQEPEQRRVPRPAQKPVAPYPAPQKPPAEPAPEPVAVTAEPAVVAPAPAPKKAWPVKSKRPRFVRAKAQKPDRAAAAPLPPPSTSLFARLMTKHLVLPPKADGPSFSR